MSVLTAGDRCDDPDRLVAANAGLDAVTRTDVLPVDVDVDEWPQHAALVEEEVADRQAFERRPHRARLDLELLLPARLISEQIRQANLYHSATSTESTAG